MGTARQGGRRAGAPAGRPSGDSSPGPGYAPRHAKGVRVPRCRGAHAAPSTVLFGPTPEAPRGVSSRRGHGTRRAGRTCTPTPAVPGRCAGKAQKRPVGLVTTSPPRRRQHAPHPLPLRGCGRRGNPEQQWVRSTTDPSPGEAGATLGHVNKCIHSRGKEVTGPFHSVRRPLSRRALLWPGHRGCRRLPGSGLCGPCTSSVSHTWYRAGKETHVSSLFYYWNIFNIYSSTVCCMLGNVTGPEIQPWVKDLEESAERTTEACSGGESEGRPHLRNQQGHGRPGPQEERTPRLGPKAVWRTPSSSGTSAFALGFPNGLVGALPRCGRSWPLLKVDRFKCQSHLQIPHGDIQAAVGPSVGTVAGRADHLLPLRAEASRPGQGGPAHSG